MHRRKFLALSTLALPFSNTLLTGCSTNGTRSISPTPHTPLQNLLNELLPSWENKLNAKIGMAVITASNVNIASYRGYERFPMNSTFKAFLGANVLEMADEGQLNLTDTVTIKGSDLLEYAPTARKFFEAKQPISLAQLCEGAITLSDNTCANLLLEKVGGISVFNAFLHRIGNIDMTLAHNEPLLNYSHYGDRLDTAKPIQYTQSLKNLLTGNRLSENSKKQLITWLANDKVADDLLRKYLPKDWHIGDKTGTGDESKNIVAVIWNAQGEAYFVSLFITQPHDGKSNDFEKQKSVAMAEIGRAIYPIL